MSVDAGILQSYSPYPFPFTSHYRSTFLTESPSYPVFQENSSVRRIPWQFHPVYGEAPTSEADMTSAKQEEMEEMQQLSDQFQPVVLGPLVGTKMSIHTLIEQFRGADPTYVAKTVALAATHSAYRAIKGDGQCGWRASVFGYFETLLQIGELQMIIQEETRLRSFEEPIRMARYDIDLISDMVDCTWELFAKLKHAVETQQKDDNFLLGMFNEEAESNSIVYHFKMMTGAYMELRRDQYQPFLDMPLGQYRASRIDPTNQEIDQIGLQALTDGVIAPAGIAVEVSYLDRSHGNEVTRHDFVQNAATWPTIRLLYRPGHYDMIYKDLQPIRVLAFQRQSMYETMSSGHFQSQDMDLHSYLFPNASMYPGQSQHDTSGGSSGSIPPNYDYISEIQYHPFPSPPYSTFPTSQIPVSQEPWPSTPQVMSPILTSSTSSAAQPLPRSPSVSSPVPIQSPRGPQIRMSSAYYDLVRDHHESIPLETGSLRNSPGNENHFLSTDFQPQMWDADEEYSKQ